MFVIKIAAVAGSILAVIRDMRRSGMTVEVSHETRFARDATDRVVFMDQGQIVEQGEPSDIVTAPRHERVMAFLSDLTPNWARPATPGQSSWEPTTMDEVRQCGRLAGNAVFGRYGPPAEPTGIPKRPTTTNDTKRRMIREE